MDVFQTIRERRSVKHYDPTHSLSAEEEALLIDLGMESPSSFNLQHWRLINVKDPAMRTKLRAVAFDQEQVTHASLLFVICADFKAHEDPGEAWRNAPASVQNLMIPMASSFYQDNEQLQRDEAIRSTAFLAYAMMLTAKGMGYDSCPLIGFDPVEVSKLIGLPEGHLVSMLLTVGKATKKPWEKPGRLNRARVLFENDFSNTPTVDAAVTTDLKVETGTGFWSAVEDTFTPV